jgi:hypothetical protein
MAIRLVAPRANQPTMILLVRSERTFLPPLAPLTREVKRVLLDTLSELANAVLIMAGPHVIKIPLLNLTAHE